MSRYRDRGHERYLASRYQEEKEARLEQWYEEYQAEQLQPINVIRTLLEACSEKRLVAFVTLFDYILSVPEFVNANPKFREATVAKAREFQTEPALANVCERVVAAYSSHE